MNMGKSDERLHQAIAAARAGKYPEAKVLLNRLLEDDPDNANALFLLSALSETKEQQIARLNRVLEIQPDHSGARSRLEGMGEIPKIDAAQAEAILEDEALAETSVQETLISPPIDSLGMDQEQPVEISLAEAGASLEEVENQSEEPIDEPLSESGDALEATVVAATILEPPVSDDPADFEGQAEGDTVPDWMAEDGETIRRPAEPAEATEFVEPPAIEEELPDWLVDEPLEELEEPGQAADLETTLISDRSAVEQVQEEAPEKPASEPSSVKTKGAKKSRIGALEILLILLVIIAVIVVGALVVVLLNLF
jgi:hypothetical protein